MSRDLEEATKMSDPNQSEGAQMHTRVEEIRLRTANHVAKFQVGDTITFYLTDDSPKDDPNTDPEEIELTGRILNLEGDYARVEHKYGICRAWLPTAQLHVRD